MSNISNSLTNILIGGKKKSCKKAIKNLGIKRRKNVNQNLLKKDVFGVKKEKNVKQKKI